MTEQQNQSAVVEETREAVETTPQPENNDKKKAGNKTSLALSAIAIAIAIAAGIGLYGLNLSLIHISEPTRLHKVSRMPSSA